jgi:hypothetical protein
LSPGQIEDAIRGAAALITAMADRNLDDAEALADRGPSWALAIWLVGTLRSAGADPARWAAVVIADSVAFEAGQDQESTGGEST